LLLLLLFIGDVIPPATTASGNDVVDAPFGTDGAVDDDKGTDDGNGGDVDGRGARENSSNADTGDGGRPVDDDDDGLPKPYPRCHRLIYGFWETRFQ
jgi:hypothetical protein